MSKALMRAFRLHDAVTSGGFLMAQICLFVIVFSYVYETVSRYFFFAPTSWSNEIVGYALCIGTFLALPEVTRRQSHIAITFLIDLAPQGARRYLDIVLGMIAGLICLLVAWICLRANIQHVSQNVMLVRVRPIPKIWISAFLTYGFLSTSLYFCRLAFTGARPAPQSKAI